MILFSFGNMYVHILYAAKIYCNFTTNVDIVLQRYVCKYGTMVKCLLVSTVVSILNEIQTYFNVICDRNMINIVLKKLIH